MFRKTDIQRLQADNDWTKLGRLLDNKDEQIRREATRALVAVLHNNLGRRVEIAKLFGKGKKAGVVEELVACVTPSSPYQAAQMDLCFAISWAGGQDQLVKIIQTAPHEDVDWRCKISKTLVAIALSGGYGVKELVPIIPYMCLREIDYFANAKKLEEAMREMQPAPVSKGDFNRILDQVRNLQAMFDHIPNEVTRGLPRPAIGDEYMAKVQENDANGHSLGLAGILLMKIRPAGLFTAGG